jgi:hypothetical protein
MYTYISHSKPLQNIYTQIGIFGTQKYTIWQPWKSCTNPHPKKLEPCKSIYLDKLHNNFNY